MHEDDEGWLGEWDGELKEESNLNWDHQGTRWINLMEMNLFKTNSIAGLDTPKHDGGDDEDAEYGRTILSVCPQPRGELVSTNINALINRINLV